MIIYKENENLFESKMQTLTNTVNCVGVMGAGIALEFKKRYPQMFLKYKKICDKKLLKTGMLQIFKEGDKLILNFPTKEDWRNSSKISYLELGLQKLVDTYKDRGITSLAIPQLGCSNGGLNWLEVKPLMEKYLNQLDIPVEIYVRTK